MNTDDVIICTVSTVCRPSLRKLSGEVLALSKTSEAICHLLLSLVCMQEVRLEVRGQLQRAALEITDLFIFYLPEGGVQWI